MIRRMRQITLYAATLLLALPAFAQVGHPAKGSWLGYWGTGNAERHRMLLLLDWENRELVGTINPGRNAVPVKRAEIDYDNWLLTIEADMPLDDGGTAPFVAIGRLENLGSWVNRRYSGTYTHGEESGTFRLVMN